MSAFLIDAGIWLLLFVSVGFGGIGLIGLLLFPDTRSRQYTSCRATLISINALGLAVILFGLFAFMSRGGSQYLMLTLHTLLLLAVMVTANLLVSRAILNRTHVEYACQSPASQDNGNEK